MPEPTNNQLWGDYEATCGVCGRIRKLKDHASAGLVMGAALYRSEDPNFDKCHNCKSSQMTITKVPQPKTPEQPPGFWNIPKS
jgi:hypothetical protein